MIANELPFPGGRRNDTGRGEPVRVRWLGTAGFELEHEGHVVLIDPYLTRASLARCVLAPLRPDLAVIRRHVVRADAIIAGHTHFDHVLDVPAIARMTGATVFGSRSAITLCRAQGVPEGQLRDVQRPASSEAVVAESGPFRLTFVPSTHSRFLLGRVPFPGDIEDCDDVPLRTEAYRCGAVFGVEIEVAGRRIYHVGSADLVDGNVRTRDTDLALLCVAGWTSTRGYPERITRALSPRAVLLSHWDSFLHPIHEPARELPRMQTRRLVDRLREESRDVIVGALPLLGEIFV